MLASLAKLIFPIPTPVIWTAFGLGLVWATYPISSFVLWDIVGSCRGLLR